MEKNVLLTPWGENFNRKKVHMEYPRPKMVRDSFFCLNGEWDYTIQKEETIETYQGKILVPFSPESYLSGVEHILQPGEFLFYRKRFVLPDDFIKNRVLLHFGAVDQICTVYCNGEIVGTHEGGYLPFTFDITKWLVTGENEIVVKVKDDTEHSPFGRGKQKLEKKGHMSSIFYTPSSGIWKTVWIESVPQHYIQMVKLTPLFDEEKIAVEVITNEASNFSSVHKRSEAQIQIFWKEECIYSGKVETNHCKQQIAVSQMHPWSPSHPNLYQIQISYGEDNVISYFAMRKFHREKDKKGIWRTYLNNKPFFFNGVLDQGYWPESLLTPPTDEALQYDIKKLKALGFNTIRKHVKVESERFYYHCDQIGMVVWQDMPNGGGDYNMGFVTYLPNAFPIFGRMIKDSHYSWFKRKDKQGREQFSSELKEMVETLSHYPCIAVWTPFNEGWGQFDANKATQRIRQVDPTRLVNEACGWFDQKGGDFYSIHNYLRQLKITANKNRVVALTEFGGYAYPVANHMYSKKEFGYKDYKNKDELTNAFQKLYETDIYPNIEKGLCSAIYTQTSDIEEEINGFMTYDRKVNKMDEDVVRAVNQKIYEIYQTVVCN